MALTKTELLNIQKHLVERLTARLERDRKLLEEKGNRLIVEEKRLAEMFSAAKTEKPAPAPKKEAKD